MAEAIGLDPIGHQTAEPIRNYSKRSQPEDILEAQSAATRLADCTESTGTAFFYKPIDNSVDTIRVLILDPAPKEHFDSESPINCRLEHRTFASKPKYEALSYVWGTDSPSSLKSIWVDNIRVEVRENLFNALYHLRDYKTNQPWEADNAYERILWVDFLCINQADVEERNIQVGLMAFIFSRAVQVIVWLGIPHIMFQRSSTSDIFRIYDEVNRLLANSYWSRLWILQEVGLARSLVVQCGWQHCSWNKFFQTISSSRYELPGQVLKLKEHRDNRHQEDYHLEQLLGRFIEAECSEPRDKIYGFLGLAHDCQDDSIPVDYSASFYNLYADVMEFHSHATPYLGAKECFPDFNDRGIRMVSQSRLIQKVFGNAVQREIEAGQVLQRERRYHVKGWIAGEIMLAGPGYNAFVSSSKANKSWKRSFATGTDSPSNLSLLRATDELFTVSIIDMSPAEIQRASSLATLESWGYIYGSMVEEESEARQRLTEAYAKDDKPSTTEPYRFLGTNLLMGLAPANARVGDYVCQFWNCDIGIVVRKVDNFEDFYRIIGRAIVAPGPATRLERVMETFEDEYEDNMEQGREWSSRYSPLWLSIDLKTLQALTY